MAESSGSGKQVIRQVLRFVLFLLMLYFFLVAIQLFGHSVKIVGAEAAKKLFDGLSNPFAGLAVGILATVLVQSSSVTTSMVVALVGTGEMNLAQAVPIIMGANIGTSITNTLVSLGHIGKTMAFQRAFAGATVHDIFNLLVVVILFPFELTFGFLQHGAERLVAILPVAALKGGDFKSPLKTIVKWFAKLIESFFHDVLHMQGNWLAGALAVTALVLIVISLTVITKNMRLLMADRIEQWLNRVLRKSNMLGLVIGTVVTMIVQSSSITTSLLVPMFGAGVLTIEAGFPIMLGANIGTTVTAILAASVTGPAGLTIALVHLLFNMVGTILFLPIGAIRRIPIWLAQQLAKYAAQNRVWVLVYILGVFFLAPVLGILIWK